MIGKLLRIVKWFAMIACVLIGMTQPASASSLPDGEQTFSGYTFANGVGTSPDGFFTLRGYVGDSTTQTTLLQADSFGSFINDSSVLGQQTAYFEIRASNTLGSFRLHDASIGEYALNVGNNPGFSDVTVKGYAGGILMFSTTPYTSTLSSIELEYPIDFSAVQNMPIDSFRVYYTKDEGYTHPEFNLISFTIGEATTEPPVLSSDATLKVSSTVKGRTVTSLGTPGATLNAAVAGTVTITTAQAANTANLAPYITLFDATDEYVTSVKIVKYASSASTVGFETDDAYANEAISDGDFFIVKVTAQDRTTVLYYRINVTAAPELIGAAAVSITPPVAGAAQDSALLVEAATAHSDYTVTGFTWNEGMTLNGKFKAGQVYTANVTLTSKNFKAFQAGSFTPAVAGSVSVSGTITSGTGIGNTVTFMVTYAPTAPLAVTGIALTTQPAKMSYTEVEDGTLALNGMVITETYNDGTNGTVSFIGGTAPGYTANPLNGTALTNMVHNGAKVTVTHTVSGQWAQTDALTVAPAPTYGISLDPGTDCAFPDATVGYGSQTAHIVTVNSTGTGVTGPLSVTLTGTNASDFELSKTTIASIVSLGSDSFTVAPKTGLASGSYTATVTVSGSSVASQSFNVSFTVNDTFGISLDPGTDYTFPAAYAGYGAQTAYSAAVNNEGTGATGPLTVALGGTNSAAFELSATSISSIAASGSDSFTVAPKTGLVAGNYTATVTVSGGSVLSQSFNVSFTVNDTFGISLDPGTDYTFPAAYVGYGAQIAYSVTVNNEGTGATGSLTVALGGTNSAAFDLSATSISSIAASGSDIFTVVPKTGLVAGNYTATVTVSGSSVASQSFNVSFTVNNTFGISLDPGTDYTFPGAYVGYGEQTAYSVTVNNTGTGATGLLTVVLSGANSNAFELSATSISSLAALGSDSFTVAPKTGLVSGSYTATVTVSGGSGVSQSFDVGFIVNDTFGIFLNPGTEDTFPATAVGYGAQTAHTVTVFNSGTGATGPLTVALGGINPAAFELSVTSISSIAASGSDSFTIAPKTGLASGTYTATVTVSGASVASRSIDISFTVNDTYGISLDPGTDYIFPAADVGYGAQTAYTVTVNNAGSGATGPLTVVLGGTNPTAFELSATSITSIAALGSDSFSVAPKTGLVSGMYTATVTISGGSVASQSFNVSFSVGDTFGISLDPGMDYTFPAATVGYGMQAAHTVTVNNTGTGATGPLTVALSGANSTAFELSTTSISSLAALGSDSFTVVLKTGLASGSYTATVTVSGGSVGAQSFDVSFTVNDTFGIFLNPGTEDTFPAAAVGYGTQTAHTITVFNGGTGATGPLTVALGGTIPAAFELSATSISSIAASGSDSFTIAPKTGLASGTYTATVTVSGVSVASRSIDVSFTVNDTYGILLDPVTDYIFPAADVGYGAQTAHTVTVNNAGTGVTGPLTVVLGGTNPAAFELSATSITSIAVLGSDSFAVTPKTGLAAGNYTATVTVSGGFSIVPQSLNVSFKVNYVMSEGVLEEQVESATITVEGMFAEEARLIVTPIADGDADRVELEEQLSEQNAIAAYEVHVEPAEAFRPPLTLTFQVGQTFNGRTVYILHKLSNGSTDIYTPTVKNGEAVITVNELSPFLLAVDPKVTIVQQPQSALALVGQTVAFHVEANGLNPLNYRWQRRTSASASWEDITGASSPDYTTSALNRSHDGYQYRVIVTDVLGNSVTSDTATLSVNNLPSTGDASQPLAYAFMTVLFAVIFLLLLKKRRAV